MALPSIAGLLQNMAERSEYTLHVPMRLNSGARVPRAYVDRIEARLVAIAGGFTRARTVGAFAMSDGSVKREPVYVYSVLAGRGAARGMRRIASDIRRDLAQESVLLTVTDGISVDFV